MENKYKSVNPKQNFPLLEREILDFWKREQIFEKSIAKNSKVDAYNYVFYDGPPFANGLPHYGHLLTGYVKDLIPRFKTMQGFVVNRRFGWDCHGLPAEMDAQKQLGINGRKEIIEHGIGKFNDHCKQSVMKYAANWEQYVNKQARWVDMENAYKTMDIDFMESVLWAFSELWKKGLIYEGDRVMPYSWALETPLSNFETRLDNSYRKRQDPAITIAVEIMQDMPTKKPLKALVWTTTPWTLPSNLALAVNGDLNYQIWEMHDCQYVVGEQAVEKYRNLLGNATIVKTVKGKLLTGLRYKPIFPYFNHLNAFQILDGDFVTENDGTGIVHLAPGFGEDDQILCGKHGIAPVCPIDSKAKFNTEIKEYEGLQVFEANKPIIAHLKKTGALFKLETIEHNYPHCWRTDTPLIYRAQKSWYVKVSAFKERMVELNDGINWIPDYVKKGSFGGWLEGAKDWSISRNRFFGTPIPIWKSDDEKYPRIDVYGSLAEIEADFDVKLTDLHKPFIDGLDRKSVV